MSHQDKLARFRDDLAAQGLWKSNAMPPMFRVLWRLGLEVPPPYFLSFRSAWLAAGVPFGLVVALFLGLGSWLVFGLSWAALVGIGMASLFGGTIFGLVMAYWWGGQSKKMELPEWRDY